MICSGRFTECWRPSSVTSIGVIWLSSTLPVDWSRTWASTGGSGAGPDPSVAISGSVPSGPADSTPPDDNVLS
jgi:hypothetical protein